MAPRNPSLQDMGFFARKEGGKGREGKGVQKGRTEERRRREGEGEERGGKKEKEMRGGQRREERGGDSDGTWGEGKT